MTRIFYLCADPALVRAQISGERLTRARAGPLRDDISTDEITPIGSLVHFDATLGRHAHTGFAAGGERPIGRDALRQTGAEVLVGGRRYGKGSSREHSPLAELSAGIRIVVAESFERIYRQNADNLGLLTSTRMDLLERLESGGAVREDEWLADRDAQAADILRAGGLLRWRPATASVPPHRPSGPRTLFQKIVDRHRTSAGLVRADWRFVHEYYTGMCAHLLASSHGEDAALKDPGSIICFEDHLSYAHRSALHAGADMILGARRLSAAHREFAARHGLIDHGPLAGGEGSQGISHAVMAERYACPGGLVVGTDSHTPHSGALGCVAFGIGSTEMVYAWLTGEVRMGETESLRIEVEGQLPEGSSAKDLVLHLLARPEVRQGAGLGRVFEFCGSGVRALCTDERATLTNMTAELGGLTGIVEPDEETRRFIRERRGEEASIEPWMHSDPGAAYALTLKVDAATVSPWVARPGDPGRGLPLDELESRPGIDIAYGGSCTAGKREDFVQYHAVLAWAAARGLRVAAGCELFLQFGTTEVRDWCEAQGWMEIFRSVGAELLLPACGACANCGPGASTRADQVTVSAINRNFPGRSGPGQVWLASPATVAASAIAGRLVSFAELRTAAATPG
ncbi:MAG: 3-isopropylmalate dehydratase [Burkholderiales bacterium]|nr:3-isopropylmalate dehydratase [Burkholderiales bacterium]